MPDISIVTISFNQVRFLRECIESILSQADVDVEYIVVDPGSTDGSRELIESYGDRIIRIFERDCGPADGLNIGFSKIHSPLCGFLNSDDVLLPGALSGIEKYFAKSPHIDLATGAGQFIDEFGKPIRAIIPSKFTPWLYVYGAVSVFQQGTFFRTSAFRKTRGFNINNHTCWDGELFIDMCLKGAKTALLPQQLALFRIHSMSITGSNRLEALYLDDSARLFQKVVGRARKPRDRIVTKMALLWKYASTPSYLMNKLKAL